MNNPLSLLGEANENAEKSYENTSLAVVQRGTLGLPAGLTFTGLGDRASVMVQPKTIISITAFCLSAAFLGIGAFLLYKMRDEWIPLEFFTCSDAMIIVYAFGYSSYLNLNPKERADNPINARSVMRWIFCLTSLAFAWSCFYMRGFADQSTLLFTCFVGGPGALFAFSIVYGIYAKACTVDIVQCKNNQRKGTAMATIGVMTVLTILTFICNTVRVVLTLNESNIWDSLFWMAVAIIVCIFVVTIFRSVVEESEDRGIKFESSAAESKEQL